MTRDEHKKAIQSLLGMVSSEHQAEASEILTNLSDDYEETLTASETAANNVAELTKNNETLRSVNAKLFLRVGETEKLAHVEQTETGDNGKDDEKPLPFSDLFNEKGELI